MISISGFELLSDGVDGIRYAWRKGDSDQLIESAAFNNKTKNIISDVCGYTTSVSAGCVLSKLKSQCKFCRTGNNLQFGGFLSDKEIAKQNVFMVLSDMYCEDHPELKTKNREFAYMGQGEPGFSYRQVRSAIEITNIAMRELGQTVYRHIFATAGVPEAIEQYTEDIQGYFTERVTLHFSLHATNDRSNIMPINNIFPYYACIDNLNKVTEVSNEKPCIGVLLFNEYSPHGSLQPYTNSKENVLSILKELDPQKCRLSFCEFNSSPELGVSKEYPQEDANSVLQLARDEGFESKLFSSFGKVEQTACGMLGGKSPKCSPTLKLLELDRIATDLIEYCVNSRNKEGSTKQ